MSFAQGPVPTRPGKTPKLQIIKRSQRSCHSACETVAVAAVSAASCRARSHSHW